MSINFIDLSYLVTPAISWVPLIWVFKFSNLIQAEMKKEIEALNYQGKQPDV